MNGRIQKRRGLKCTYMYETGVNSPPITASFDITQIHILEWKFVTRSCLKPQNPCPNHEIYVLFEHGFYLKKPKLGPNLHA